MSVEAITWALQQPIEKSSAKFVLVVLANCASSEGMTTWPSIQYLSESTGQNRKTVIESIARLKSWGYLEDTGERKGVTKQVIVYRLKSPKKGTLSVCDKGTEKGTVKQFRKRNSTENGTVPKTDGKSTENGHKQSQKRDTEPLEPLEPKDKKRAQGALVTVSDLVADGIEADLASEFLAHRKRKRAALTPRAWTGIKAQARKAGWSASAALAKALERGWTSFEAHWVLETAGVVDAPKTETWQ